eukprot:Gb_05682 [translate_table: standard]
MLAISLSLIEWFIYVGNYVPIAQVCDDAVAAYMQEVESQTDEMLQSFRQMCNSKQVQTEIVVLEDDNVPKAILKQVSTSSISKLVMGSSSRNVITRKLKGPDIPASVAIKAPKSCSVYVISKGKLASVHSAVSLPPEIVSCEDVRNHSSLEDRTLSRGKRVSEIRESATFHSQHLLIQRNQALSYVNRFMSHSKSNLVNRILEGDKQISRSPSIGNDMHKSPSAFKSQISDVLETIEYSESTGSSLSRILEPISEAPHVLGLPDSEVEIGAEQNGESLAGLDIHRTSRDNADPNIENRTRELGIACQDFDGPSASKEIQIHTSSLKCLPEIQTELERLKLKLWHTQDMYNAAFEEAIDAKHKAECLNARLIEEARKLAAAKVREEMARARAAEDNAKYEEARKEAEAARQTAEKEVQQRMAAELRAIKESYERKKAQDALQLGDRRYRKYSIEEIESATDYFSESLKIGEGGYGPVYKCNLDHITVAIKVLQTDEAQGRREFQQEIDVLSHVHHPHIVLLLGACPDRGCLVYEYMANGSLDDRLFHGGTTTSLPWFLRFRIASEIASALLFLHKSKPEPIVHRDLKPANILLDHNFVSKIGDVGLARLVPPTASCSFTEYNNTLLAGTFFYMDPEYQRTGTLHPKSDLYALGIVLLQLLTAKTPMGLTDTVERAVEKGLLKEILDKSAGDWPLDESLELAKLALKCSELRRRDRPDLETVVLPELERFKALAGAHVLLSKVDRGVTPPGHFFCPILQVVMEDPHIAADGVTYEYRAIKAWLENNNTLPMENPRLSQKHLIPNHSLRSAIFEWRLKTDTLFFSEFKI